MVNANRILRQDEPRDQGFLVNGDRGTNEDLDNARLPQMPNHECETPEFQWNTAKDDVAEL